ncbi:MAG: Zn-ribbon containing protein, partial [Candidatus Thermoplasmatota archaeon]
NKTKKTSEETKEETKEEKKLDEHEIKNMIDEYHKEQEKHRDQPETILIERTGKYIIDVKGLLEYEPIIIHKDGVYTIHLPSVFRMINKKRD